MIHIFDVDYTVIRRSSTWYFLCEALARKVVAFSQIRGLPIDWFRYKMGRAKQEFIEEAVKRIVGIEKGVLEQIAEDSFVRRLKFNIYSGAVNLINEIRSRGETVLFATSSFHILIKPLEHFLGITESLASTLEFKDGKTTGRLEGESFFGERKKTAVAAWLEERALRPEELCFYSDSYTDLPLLAYCGKPVAINPDRFLEREAKKRGWQIIRFRETLGQT
ncbi:MAG: HAD-IB family hydrolase [Treponema sp.]|nr:HAD-IB family hydrolase [Treponema sp.]